MQSLPDDPLILDVGCGTGRTLRALQALGYQRLAGVDLDPTCVKACHADGLRFVEHLDAREIRVWHTEQEFSLVLALDVIEHLDMDEALGLVQDLCARLLPGGLLVMSTPNLGSICGPFVRYSDATHRIGLTERSAAQLLNSAGFTDEEFEISSYWSVGSIGHTAARYWLSLVHRAVWWTYGRLRPRVASPNLFIRVRPSVAQLSSVAARG